MLKKFFVALFAMFVSVNVLAHDEGHGPKIKNAGKYGGKLSSVILKKEENSKSAQTQFVAELVVTSAGEARLYFFDEKMQPYAKEIKAVTGSLTVKGEKATSIVFTKEGDSYNAKIEKKAKSKSLELNIEGVENTYFVAFPRI